MLKERVTPKVVGVNGGGVGTKEVDVSVLVSGGC